jgi:SAM-dependent methyltransferase
VVQHGSLTYSQLQAIIGHVQAVRPARVLDLGCGVGEPGVLIARAGGAGLLGVDRCTSAISLAERSATRDASFILADLEAYSSRAPRDSADVVLAIDALYWTEDLESLLKDVFEIVTPGGCFLCISSEFDETRSGAAVLAPDEMEIGAALEAVSEERGDLRVESRDFTEEERSLWLGSLALCEEWEEAFTAEGRAYLLRNIVREAEYLESSMRHGRGARRLFAAYRADASSIRRSKRSRAAAAVSRARPV